MNLFSLFTGIVMAAETVLSPIPDGTPVIVPPPPKPAISFGEITAIPTPTPTPEVHITPTAAPTPPPPVTKKKSYTIAFLGDSMIDTMGPGLPAVQSKLSSMYGGTNFTLLNYGVGATNLDYGIERITNSYNYLGNQIPALASTRPDIVVLESFAYNLYPDADGGVTRHWVALSHAVDTLRQAIPGVKLVIAATIAPNSKVFGDGAAGVSIDPVGKVEHTKLVKQYLDSTVQFARGEHLPLADAYHASLDANGDGILTYINGGDHIHYSDAGRALLAQKVAGAISANHLLE